MLKPGWNVRLAALALSLGFSGMCAARADVADGVAAYEKGDYKRAIEEWQPAAAKDDVDALFNLGQVYRLGKGVPQDFEMAEHYYLRAAELGHPVAQGNLATLYYFMKKPKPDKQKAAYWWNRAAKAGDARSQLNLGILYYNGDYVQKDLVTAYAWISLAYRGGIKEANDSLDKLKPLLNAKQLAQAEAMIGTLVDKTQDVRIVAPEQAQPAAAAAAQTPPAGAAPKAAASAPASAVPVKAVPVKPAPPPPPAAKLPTAPAGAAGYAVQLASVGSAAEAQKEWAKLQKQYADLLGGFHLDVAKADLGPAKGTRYRVRAGGIATRDEAIRICEALRNRKAACLAVKAGAP